MEKLKRKLVALTHNYIGSNVANCLPNKVLELEERVIVSISGEYLWSATHPVHGENRNREWVIEQVRDPEIALQKPEVLLLYVGHSPIQQALAFAALFEGAEIHLVLNEDSASKASYRKTFDPVNYGYWPIIHFAESTGNVTMGKLIQQFRSDGLIPPEPTWW